MRDHERTRLNEERGVEADEENGTEGEECMKPGLEREKKMRARKILMQLKRGYSLGKLEER